MTPPPDLPPSFGPGASGSSNRRSGENGERRASSAGSADSARRADAGSPPTIRRPPAPAGRSAAQAPQRRSLRQEGSKQGADAGSAGQRRPGSHVRPGSSAVPIGQRPSGPEPTRALPTRGAASSGAAWNGQPDAGFVRPDSPFPPSTQPEGTPEGTRRRRPLRWEAAILVLLLVLIMGRVAWLWHDIDSKLDRIEALSGAKDTPGETWLIVGSDSRDDGGVPQDGTEGSRADSIMVLHKASNGQASLISLPRDTYVEIPGYDDDKINAAYSYGQAPLLVETAEKLTGLTMDHYVEVGMGGVTNMVDAVDGVEVCLDYDVDDPDSSLVWDTSKGTCQKVDGEKALAYSRMRKSDPTGDIGRAQRQRAVVSAVVSKAMSAQTLINPFRQDKLVDSGTKALTVDEDASALDLGQMALAFRSASNKGLTGAPPIESLDYEPGGIGAAVLLQDTTAPDFFSKMRSGKLTSKDFDQP